MFLPNTEQSVLKHLNRAALIEEPEPEYIKRKWHGRFSDIDVSVQSIMSCCATAVSIVPALSNNDDVRTIHDILQLARCRLALHKHGRYMAIL